MRVPKFMHHLRWLIYLLVVVAFSTARAGSYEDYFVAVKRDHVGAVEELLVRGFDPNTLSTDGFAGLFLALRGGSLKVAELLIALPQTDVNWRSKDDETALMMTALKGYSDLARQLVARDADVNKTGWTPLHYAATSGHLDILALLIEHNAYLDAESPNGSTPLMMAAMYGSSTVVEQLLEAGADPELKNQLGLTALDFARRGHREAAAELILKAIRAKQPKNQW